jgi:hypothetical protein
MSQQEKKSFNAFHFGFAAAPKLLKKHKPFNAIFSGSTPTIGTNIFKTFYYPTKVNRFAADDKLTEPNYAAGAEDALT